MHVQIRYLSHNESPYIASYGDYMTRERLMNDKVTYLSNKVHSVFFISKSRSLSQQILHCEE